MESLPGDRPKESLSPEHTQFEQAANDIVPVVEAEGQDRNLKDTDKEDGQFIKSAREQVEDALEDTRPPLVSNITDGTRPTNETDPTAVAGKKPKIILRPATEKDIERIAEIDMAAYGETYQDPEDLSGTIRQMMERRFRSIQQTGDSRWMTVAEVDGVVQGFITGFLTNKTYKDFVSWEDSTANGTLEGVADPTGKQLYVANLTVMPGAQGYDIDDMLVTNIVGGGVGAGVNYGFFSARIPGFRAWLTDKASSQGIEIDDLSSEDIDVYAGMYFESRRDDGQRLDWQLRYYESAGMKPRALVSEALEDPESLNYGVVVTAENPVPKPLRLKPINWLAGKTIRLISKYPKVLKKLL